MKSTAVLAVCIALATASCTRRDEAPPAPPPTPLPAAPSAERLTLAERLTAEAASRPAGGLRAEQVAAALGRAGIDLRPMKQVLARTVNARFCMSAATAAGLGVAVCEFADDADAAHGLDYSRRVFDRLIPDRRIVRNHRTVLTVTPPQASAALDEQAARAVQVFASL